MSIIHSLRNRYSAIVIVTIVTGFATSAHSDHHTGHHNKGQEQFYNIDRKVGKSEYAQPIEPLRALPNQFKRTSRQFGPDSSATQIKTKSNVRHVQGNKFMVFRDTMTQDTIDNVSDVYISLFSKQRPFRIAQKLTKLLKGLEVPCAKVVAYRPRKAHATERNVEILCKGNRHAYSVTVTMSGHVKVKGGDGTIEPIAEGMPNVVIPSEREERTFNNHTKTMALREEQERIDLNNMLAKVALASLIIFVAFFVFSIIAFVRSFSKDSSLFGTVLNYNSRKKDEMIEESDEILSNLYHHPSGLFIARGPRGKRRLYNNILSGYLYKRYGWNLKEVR